MPCHQQKSYECKIRVTVALPRCKHEDQIECYKRGQVEGMVCGKQVRIQMPCSHIAPTLKKVIRHSMEVRCGTNPAEVQCDNPCLKPCEKCGQPCPLRCWQDCHAEKCQTCEAKRQEHIMELQRLARQNYRYQPGQLFEVKELQPIMEIIQKVCVKSLWRLVEGRFLSGLGYAAYEKVLKLPYAQMFVCICFHRLTLTCPMATSLVPKCLNRL